jgi:hypothetical protein
LCQSGGALRSKGKANRNEQIRKAEENYATPLMDVTMDIMEPNRISKEQTQQENEQAEGMNFKTRLGTAVISKYANICVHL